MIAGVLRHSTEMEIDRQYVDSHEQSEVTFAFCRLLGFQLLPRLKPIHTQRLFRPEAGVWIPSALNPVPSRPIDWKLIRQQNNQVVKCATALRLGTAHSEIHRSNVQPTYLQDKSQILATSLPRCTPFGQAAAPTPRFGKRQLSPNSGPVQEHRPKPIAA